MMVKNKVPGLIYFGSKKGTFMLFGLNAKSKQFVLDGKIVLMVVGLDEDIKYPINGKIKKGEKLAEMFGAGAGSIVCLNDQCEPLHDFTFSYLAHEADHLIIEDIISYLSKRKYVKKKDRHGYLNRTNIFSYSQVTGHASAWKALQKRIIPGSDESKPAKGVYRDDQDYPFYVGDKKDNVKNHERKMFVITESIGKITVVQVSELINKYKGKMPIVVLSREDQKESFARIFKGAPNVSFGVLGGGLVAEYPIMIYSIKDKALRCKGYMPPDVFKNYFSDSEKWANKNVERVDKNIPVGEFMRLVGAKK